MEISGTNHLERKKKRKKKNQGGRHRSVGDKRLKLIEFKNNPSLNEDGVSVAPETLPTKGNKGQNKGRGIKRWHE